MSTLINPVESSHSLSQLKSIIRFLPEACLPLACKMLLSPGFLPASRPIPPQFHHLDPFSSDLYMSDHAWAMSWTCLFLSQIRFPGHLFQGPWVSRPSSSWWLPSWQVSLAGPLSGLSFPPRAIQLGFTQDGASLVLVAIIDLCIHYYNFLAIDNEVFSVCTKSPGGLVGKAVQLFPLSGYTPAILCWGCSLGKPRTHPPVLCALLSLC